MKKLLALALSTMCCVTAFVGCGEATPNPTDNKYTITFVQDGADDVVYQVKSGEDLTEIPTPKAKKGYTVTWESTDLTNITKNITVHAVNTPNTYTITYQLAQDETMNAALTQIVTYDATYELSIPEKDSYAFMGWQYDEAILQQSGVWSIDENVTLSATWELNIWTITFVQDGEEDIVKTVGKGSALTDIPTVKPVEGYDVVWSVTDFSNITENMTVTAVKTAKNYRVAYEIAADETMETTTKDVTFGAEYTLDQPTKEGYSFVAWMDKETGKIVPETGIWAIASNVTLQATWTANKNEVTFIHWDGTKETREIATGEVLTDIPTPKAKDGYNVAWNRTDFTGIVGTTTVTATLTAKTYTVTYALKDGESMANTAADVVTFDAAYTLKTPVRYGYTFVAWLDGDGKTVSAVGEQWSLAKDVTLTAVWNDNFYTITFKQAGYEDIVKMVENGDTLKASDIPAVQAKKGYQVQWDTTDFSQVTTYKNVFAVETANKYTITYKDLKGGTISGETSFEVTYGEAYRLETPKRDNYEFTGWEIIATGEKIDDAGIYAYDGNLELQASWKPKEEWTKNY